VAAFVAAAASVAEAAEPVAAFVAAAASVAEAAEPVVAFVVGAASVAEAVGPVVAFVVGAASVAEAAEPVAAFVVAVVEPGVVSVAGVAELQAAVDIALVFAVSVPVAAVAVEVDSPGRPRFLVFPNVDYYASLSSSAEDSGWEFVHIPTDVRTNYGLCSILSILDLRQNKTLEQYYNNPNPGCNNVSDTNDLPMDATTSHSRKTRLHRYRGQRTRRPYRASRSHREVPQIRWAVAEQSQHLYLPLPLLEWDLPLPTPKG
jgi:hypothetical protein